MGHALLHAAGHLGSDVVDDAILLLDGHDAAEPEVSEVLPDELHSAHFG